MVGRRGARGQWEGIGGGCPPPPVCCPPMTSGTPRPRGHPWDRFGERGASGASDPHWGWTTTRGLWASPPPPTPVQRPQAGLQDCATGARVPVRHPHRPSPAKCGPPDLHHLIPSPPLPPLLSHALFPLRRTRREPRPLRQPPNLGGGAGMPLQCARGAWREGLKQRPNPSPPPTWTSSPPKPRSPLTWDTGAGQRGSPAGRQPPAPNTCEVLTSSQASRKLPPSCLN